MKPWRQGGVVFLLLMATGCGSSNERSSSANQGATAGWRIQNCNSVGYVTNSYSGPVTHSVSMTFQIVTTGAPSFNYVMESDNTCTTPASVRLFLERKNDDFTGEFYRWWANPVGYELQPMSGNVTLTVALTPDQWSSVYGKVGNYDATTLAGFHDVLTNLGRAGMTFGGGCFFGHGVNVSDGTARFVLINYTIS